MATKIFSKKDNSIFRKVILGTLILILIINALCIYVIGGMAGVYAWNISVLILAPLAAISIIPQVLLWIIRIFMKKKIKWNSLFLIISFISALPLTIILGNTIPYPKKQPIESAIKITSPIKDGIILNSDKLAAHAILPSECYAYDIVKEPYLIGSKDLNDYGIYMSDVVSPVSGTIIGVENSEEDVNPNSGAFENDMGNYVFIEVEETGNYIILSHLANGSIPFSVGDTVNEGEYIGKVGNSGISSEPHLHIQYQKNNPLNVIFPTFAEGLPMIIK